MNYLSTLLLFFIAIVGMNAQEGKGKVYADDIPTKKLNGILGTTRLFAMENVSTDSVFVLFLEKYSNYTKTTETIKIKAETIKADTTKTWIVYEYKENGIIIKTRKTGLSYDTIDDFVEVVEIMASKDRKLPYSCHSAMTFREFKKTLRPLGFKLNKSKSETLFKVLKKEVFENSNINLEIWFDKGNFSRIVLTAKLDNMYGGLLIVK
jgi:hypothetical protein